MGRIMLEPSMVNQVDLNDLVEELQDVVGPDHLVDIEAVGGPPHDYAFIELTMTGIAAGAALIAAIAGAVQAWRERDKSKLRRREIRVSLEIYEEGGHRTIRLDVEQADDD